MIYLNELVENKSQAFETSHENYGVTKITK